MGNIRQIRSIYRATQLVLTESDDSDPGYFGDLRRNSSGCSAAARMADADCGSLKRSFAFAVCNCDDRSSGDQGTLGRLRPLRSRWSVSSGQLVRISIQYRLSSAQFARSISVEIGECRVVRRLNVLGWESGVRPHVFARAISCAMSIMTLKRVNELTSERGAYEKSTSISPPQSRSCWT